jgi:ATP-dependent DNA helicase HFM1/MER3
MAMGSLLQSSQTAGSIPNTKKIVYISPSKALCDERYNDWSTRFIQVDPAIEVVVVTGDDNSSGNSFQNVASAHVILTTPEKWDSITRKWTDHLALLSSVKLLMIDEVHLLGDESRGSCLETLICRMKTVQRAASASKEGVQKRNHQR